MVAFVLLATPDVARAQQSEVVEYYAHDAIGSIRVVFDVNGVPTARQDYGPFGRPLFPSSQMPPEGFAAQDADAETDGAYFHARIFQPRLGRFGRPDPIQAGSFQSQRWNRYGYALSNPMSIVDPTGLNAAALGSDANCSNPDYRTEFSGFCSYEDFLLWSLLHGGGGGGFSEEPGGGGGGVSGITTPVEPLPAPDVTNNSPNTIFIKDEKNENRDNIIPLRPGETWHGNQDGMADPCGHPGEVFKSVDYTNVVFNPRMTVAIPWKTTSIFPPAPAVLLTLQVVGGGWQGESFHQAHGDWDALFDAANSRPANCK